MFHCSYIAPSNDIILMELIRMSHMDYTLELPDALKNSNLPPFLIKLWCMLSDVQLDEIIRWDDTGQSFVILDTEELECRVLPAMYRSANFASFVRQLNLYGFRKRLTPGQSGSKPNVMEFYHPFFKRDEPQLLKNVKRTNKAEKGHTDFESLQNQIDELNEKMKGVLNYQSSLEEHNRFVFEEISKMRVKQDKQYDMMTKLVTFLLNTLNKHQDIQGFSHNTMAVTNDNYNASNLVANSNTNNGPDLFLSYEPSSNQKCSPTYLPIQHNSTNIPKSYSTIQPYIPQVNYTPTANTNFNSVDYSLVPLLDKTIQPVNSPPLSQPSSIFSSDGQLNMNEAENFTNFDNSLSNLNNSFSSCQNMYFDFDNMFDGMENIKHGKKNNGNNSSFG